METPVPPLCLAKYSSGLDVALVDPPAPGTWVNEGTPVDVDLTPTVAGPHSATVRFAVGHGYDDFTVEFTGI